MDSEEQDAPSQRPPVAPTSFVDAEHRRLVAILKERSPEEWARMVKKLSIPIPPEAAGKLITMEHVRVAATCLAWWDFFGHRTAANRWPHLDKYLNKAFVRVPRELTVAALIALGYPEKWAWSRTKEHPVQSNRVKTQNI
jgi:hypothetical protein